MNANELAILYTPPSAERVQRLRRYVEGTQYDGRAPYLAQGEGAPPVLERAPCIVDTIVARAIESHVAMLASDARWPRIEGADTLDAERSYHVRRAVRRGAYDALASGSCVMALDVDARDWVHLPHEWCSFNGADVVCCYPSLCEEFDHDSRKWVTVCYLVRVDVTGGRVTWYRPAHARDDGTMPSFTPMVSHRTAGVVRYDRDGGAIHARLLDELDALNFGLSQRHRAALYAGDPQIWERGVGEDVAQPRGRAAANAVEITADGRGPHPKGTFKIAGGASPGGGAKQKGPGVLWSHPSTTYEAQMLTLPGDALTGIDLNARDIGERIARALHFVELDLDGARVAAGMSGKALSILFERAINFVDVLRDDTGERLIVPAINTALRAAGRSEIATDATVTWGEYFADTPRSKAETYELSARAIKALSDAGIDTAPVVTALGLTLKPNVASAAPIYQYHIDLGVVTHGEARLQLGLPYDKPIDGDSNGTDVSMLPGESAGGSADVPPVRRGELVGDDSSTAPDAD